MDVVDEAGSCVSNGLLTVTTKTEYLEIKKRIGGQEDNDRGSCGGRRDRRIQKEKERETSEKGEAGSNGGEGWLLAVFCLC